MRETGMVRGKGKFVREGAEIQEWEVYSYEGRDVLRGGMVW